MQLSRDLVWCSPGCSAADGRFVSKFTVAVCVCVFYSLPPAAQQSRENSSKQCQRRTAVTGCTVGPRDRTGKNVEGGRANQCPAARGSKNKKKKRALIAGAGAPFLKGEGKKWGPPPQHGSGQERDCTTTRDKTTIEMIDSILIESEN